MAAVSKEQYGVFTRQQALSTGMKPVHIKYRLQQARWERVHQSVYRLAGMTPTTRQALMAAVLAGGEGAVLSHRAAAWLMGLPSGSPVPEITVPRGRRTESPAGSKQPEITVRGHRTRAAGVTVHTTTNLPEVDRTVLEHIPIVTPARLVVDMAAVVSVTELEILVDAVLHRGMARRSRIAWRLQELGSRGKAGTQMLAQLLEARSPEGGIPASVLESRFRPLVRGFPGGTFNRRVVAGKERVLDYDLDAVGLVAELDGWENHTGRVRFQDDMERQNALHLKGRTVMRYSYRDVVGRPEEVRGQLLTLARTLAEKTGDPALIAAWAAVDPELPGGQAICGSGTGSIGAKRRKTSTTAGSNCLPAPASSRSSASSTASAWR